MCGSQEYRKPVLLNDTKTVLLHCNVYEKVSDEDNDSYKKGEKNIQASLKDVISHVNMSIDISSNVYILQSSSCSQPVIVTQDNISTFDFKCTIYNLDFSTKMFL